MNAENEITKLFDDLSNAIYDDMYDHPGKYDESALSGRFDDLMRDGRPAIVGHLIERRNDLISSDREAAAFMVARDIILGMVA